jgi:hypothetical protein
MTHNVFILAFQKFRDDSVLIDAIECVEEPDLPFQYGAGQREARIDLIEFPSVLVLPGRKSVAIARVVVPMPVFKQNYTAASFA